MDKVLNCPRAYPSMGLRAAAKASKSNPCTNIPMPCPITGCDRVVWRYSMLDHLQSHSEGERQHIASSGGLQPFAVSSEEFTAVLLACKAGPAPRLAQLRMQHQMLTPMSQLFSGLVGERAE